jgi:hypothetical protein
VVHEQSAALAGAAKEIVALFGGLAEQLSPGSRPASPVEGLTEVPRGQQASHLVFGYERVILGQLAHLCESFPQGGLTPSWPAELDLDVTLVKQGQSHSVPNMAGWETGFR